MNPDPKYHSKNSKVFIVSTPNEKDESEHREWKIWWQMDELPQAIVQTTWNIFPSNKHHHRLPALSLTRLSLCDDLTSDSTFFSIPAQSYYSFCVWPDVHHRRNDDYDGERERMSGKMNEINFIRTWVDTTEASHIAATQHTTSSLVTRETDKHFKTERGWGLRLHKKIHIDMGRDGFFMDFWVFWKGFSSYVRWWISMFSIYTIDMYLWYVQKMWKVEF